MEICTHINNQIAIFIKKIVLFIFIISTFQSIAQNDNTTHFYGSVGLTNDGFSIVPAFSLNSPAIIANLAWQRKQFSFEPDIRVRPDMTKGSLLFWLRYRIIDKERFSLRIGAHPAFNLIRKEVNDGGVHREITEFQRFGAFEIVPSYQFSKKFGMSIAYLEGHRFQEIGPKIANILFFNTTFTDLGLSKNVSLNLFPSYLFLNVDGLKGNYLTLTTILAHKKSPFKLGSTINQTINSNIPDNKNFMWNISLIYSFDRRLKRVE